ncbi:trace amine-associated receptor 13c-like [Actinia tenebrosa]|uniref:Trace amine-associated receptor 13c-like n=1 Tax=Actinia tenebrosa TaxID=6105 RepID=A0A6P8HCA5_ACTTE|nr:trace amine-associated receptor 13c-like [Actinia tenebrosa]
MNDQNQTSVVRCGYEILHNIELSDGVISTAVINCIINGPSAVTALVFNSVVLYAILKETSLRSNANYLLAWLTVTDVLVGAIVQPLNIVAHIEILIEQRTCGINGTYDSVKFLCSMMSVMTALFISCDRCIAILFPFKYNRWVTATKIFIVLILAWLMWIILVASWTLGLAGAYVQLVCVSVMIITFVILSFIYAKMIKLAKQHQHQINSQQPSDQPPNQDVARQRKALKTAVFTIGALMACYLPIVIVVIVDIILNHRLSYSTRYIVASFAETLVHINSTLNPIIYCLRSREIRAAVFKVLTVCENGQRIARSLSKITTTTRAQPAQQMDERPANLPSRVENNNADEVDEVQQKV